MLNSISSFLILITLLASAADAQEAVKPCTEEKIIEQYSCSENVLHCHQLIEEYPLPKSHADSLLNEVLYSNPKRVSEEAREKINSILTISPAELTLIKFNIGTDGSTGKYDVVCTKNQNQAKAAKIFVKKIQFNPAKSRGRAVVYHQSWLLQPLKTNKSK